MLKFVALTTLISVANCASWNYQDGQGSDWPDSFANCALDDQSPIDLTPASATDKFTAVPFIFSEGWDLPQKADIVNNGHTLQVNIKGSSIGTCGDNMPQVTGGTMGSDVFEVAQFHLHWGNESTVGSEHTLDGAYYPAELHIVTWNTSYGDLGTAFNSEEYGSLAVLGFFLELENFKHPPLNFINKLNIGKVVEPNTEITDITIDLAQILKKINTYELYHYKGSLTTPPCHEAVIWNVFEDTIPMTENQLDLLRSMKDEDNYLMGNNYREILPLGDRGLFHYSKDNDPAYCFPTIDVTV